MSLDFPCRSDGKQHHGHRGGRAKKCILQDRPQEIQLSIEHQANTMSIVMVNAGLHLVLLARHSAADAVSLFLRYLVP